MGSGTTETAQTWSLSRDGLTVEKRQGMNMGTSEAIRSLTSVENTSVSCWDARPGGGRGNKWLFAGGLFVRTPEEPSLSRIMTEEDIQFYVQQFKKSGFR